jgi:hypothetical protein
MASVTDVLFLSLCFSLYSFLPFDHLKQVRRSYFKHSRRERGDRDGDTQSVSQASSAAYTLADQPLAEMGQNGVSRTAANSVTHSATSSLGMHNGVPQMNGGTAARNGSTSPSASQEYARAYKAQQQGSRNPSDSGSYPLQVMNEKVP